MIGPTTGGCPEAIRDGVSGYVCEPTDTIMIAKRLEDVLIRHAIEPAECRHWAEAHDIKKAAARLGALYAALLDTSS